MNKAKVALAVDKTLSVVLKVVGIVSLVFWSIGLLVGLGEYEKVGMAYIIFVLILIGLSVLLIRKANKIAKLIDTFKQYVTIISNVPNGFIPDIASSLNTSEDVVRNNLELMISKKYFVNAYIDRNLNSIIIANRQAAANTAQQTNKPATPSQVNAQSVQMVTAKCEGCGAVNTIQKGTVGECDYCGSPIEGK